MKKVICLFFILFIVGLAFAGCENHMNSIVLNNMSDMRINYYEGKNNIIFANLSCGYREETFNYDGESTIPVECGVITVGYFADCAYSHISIILNVDGSEKEYVLERSPYENVFMEDIGRKINGDSIVSLKLKNQDESINLEKVSSTWEIDYKTAIDKSAQYFQEKLSSLYFNNKLNAECYLKVVAKVDYEQKFWYFSILDKTGANFSLLMNVNTGEIISNSKN